MVEKIGEALRARLQSAQGHDTFEVDIFMEGEPAEAATPFAVGESEAADNALPAADPTAVAGRLQELAASRQRDVLGYLTSFAGEATFAADTVSVPKVSAVRSFWINNAVGAEVTLDVLSSLLERPDVIHVELTRRADITELIDAKAKAKPPGGAKKAVARTDGGRSEGTRRDEEARCGRLTVGREGTHGGGREEGPRSGAGGRVRGT